MTLHAEQEVVEKIYSLRRQNVELKQQIATLMRTIKEAEKAIKTLDVDALGFGGIGRWRWPLRDELLKDIELALSQVKNPTPTDRRGE